MRTVPRKSGGTISSVCFLEPGTGLWNTVCQLIHQSGPARRVICRIVVEGDHRSNWRPNISHLTTIYSIFLSGNIHQHGPLTPPSSRSIAYAIVVMWPKVLPWPVSITNISTGERSMYRTTDLYNRIFELHPAGIASVARVSEHGSGGRWGEMASYIVDAKVFD